MCVQEKRLSLLHHSVWYPDFCEIVLIGHKAVFCYYIPIPNFNEVQCSMGIALPYGISSGQHSQNKSQSVFFKVLSSLKTSEFFKMKIPKNKAFDRNPYLCVFVTLVSKRSSHCVICKYTSLTV